MYSCLRVDIRDPTEGIWEAHPENRDLKFVWGSTSWMASKEQLRGYINLGGSFTFHN